MFPAAAAHFFPSFLIIIERGQKVAAIQMAAGREGGQSRERRGRVNKTRPQKARGLSLARSVGRAGGRTVGNKRGITDTQRNKATDKRRRGREGGRKGKEETFRQTERAKKRRGASKKVERRARGIEL